MAHLEVQPKKRSSWLTWLIVALAVIALIFFLARRGNKDERTNVITADTTTTSRTDSANNFSTASGWNAIDFGSPRAAYAEITDKNIHVRGGNNYAIYSLGENVLFDEGKSTIRSSADKNLKQIAASIDKRYKGGEIRIYGHTDSVGSSGANQQLAEQRAEAVRDWLIKNGNVPENNISLHPVGESQPVASNASEEGRQQNRSVEIVARNAE